MSAARRVRVLERQGSWEILAALVAVGLYAQTLRFGWVYHDQMEIVLNGYAHSLQNLPLILSTTVWAGSGMETYLYRPLLLVSYALNHLVSGLEPWSYHLVNVLLLAAVSVLVARAGRLLGLSTVAAGIGGVLFALHPIHVEAVAAVFGRKDLLASLFVLAMVLLHRSAADRGGWRMALPVLAFACALLSKEVGVVGLAFVAVYDWVIARRHTRLSKDQQRGRLYFGYLATLLVYHAVRIRITGGVGVPQPYFVENPLVQAPLLVKVGTALAVVGKGLVLQLLPMSQSPDYSFEAIPLVQSVADWRLLTTLGFLGLLGWLVLRSRRTSLPFTALTCWYFLALLPTANLLAIVGTIFGERLLFLPSVAFCLAAGQLGAVALNRASWVAALPLALWAGGLSAQTVRYSAVWTDDISLFSAAVEAVPKSTKVHHKLGEELLRAGEMEASLAPLERALEIAPDNQFALRTLNQAKAQIARVYLPLRPGGPTLAPPPEDPDILYLLGQLSRQRRDLVGAEGYWEAALALDSLHAPSLGDLGTIRFLEGEAELAQEYFEKAVEIDPTLSSAWYNLGRLHLAQGRTGAGVEALETFLRVAGRRYPPLVRWARDTLAHLEGS